MEDSVIPDDPTILKFMKIIYDNIQKQAPHLIGDGTKEGEELSQLIANGALDDWQEERKEILFYHATAAIHSPGRVAPLPTWKNLYWKMYHPIWLRQGGHNVDQEEMRRRRGTFKKIMGQTIHDLTNGYTTPIELSPRPRSRTAEPSPRPRSKTDKSQKDKALVVYDKKTKNKFKFDKFKSVMEARLYISANFQLYKWKKPKITNECKDRIKNDNPYTILNLTNTQDFVRRYFTPENPYKGLLLWHSVGTGKTCSAVATVSTSFEKQGYSIIFVSRTTLIGDIWKNVFNMVCSDDIIRQIKEGIEPTGDYANDRRRMLSKNWFYPMSYKTFTNAISGKNQHYYDLVARNGREDVLKKTLLVIDEAHKLYGGDLKPAERPDIKSIETYINNSYQKSGKDSVKVLLMTATPITKDPMELIKLVNLMKNENKLPASYEKFSQKFLESNGNFKYKTKEELSLSMCPHISYLNRENDARKFAIPQFYPVKVFNNDELSNYKDNPEFVLKQNELLKKIEEIQNTYNEKILKYEKDLIEIDKQIENYDDSTVNEKDLERIRRILQKKEAIKLKIHAYREKRELIKPSVKNYENRIERSKQLEKKQIDMYIKANGQIKKVQEKIAKSKKKNSKTKIENKKKTLEKRIRKSKEMKKKKIETNFKSKTRLIDKYKKNAYDPNNLVDIINKCTEVKVKKPKKKKKKENVIYLN